MFFELKRKKVHMLKYKTIKTLLKAMCEKKIYVVDI